MFSSYSDRIGLRSCYYPWISARGCYDHLLSARVYGRPLLIRENPRFRAATSSTAQPGQPGQPCSLTSVAQRDTLHYEARVQYRDRSRGYRVEHRGVGEGRLLCRFAVGPLTAGHDNSNKLRIYNR